MLYCLHKSISFEFNVREKLEKNMENITLGIIIIVMGVVIVFVGHYFSKKIRVFHVLIYFMAVFVLLTGVLLLFAHDKPPIFFD